MDFLKNNSDGLLNLGLGLLSGKTAQEQMAGGLGGFVQAKKDAKQKNATLEMLQGKSPELVQAIEAGILSPADGFKLFTMEQAERRKAALPNRSFKTLDDGTYGWADESAGTWTPLGKATKPDDGVPDLKELYDEKTGMPYKARWNPETGTFDRVGGMKAPSGTQLSVDPTTGAVTFQQGAGLKPLTEGQSKDAVYSTRAEGALPLVDAMGDALTSLPEAVGGQIPGVGNYMKSPEYQQAEQAGREFLAAILRKDTGAAITSQEMAEYGSVYLPRPGDSPAVLEQKKVSRLRALEAIKAGMPPQAILQQQNALRASGGAAGQGGNRTSSGVQWSIEP